MSTPRQQIVAAAIPAPRGHFSHAVRAGDSVYVSGMLALDAKGAVRHPNDIARQTRAIFASLAEILEVAGGQMSSVVQLTTYVTDITARGPVNDIRVELFGSTRPASTLVEVSALAAPGAVVEIDAIAVIG